MSSPIDKTAARNEQRLRRRVHRDLARVLVENATASIKRTVQIPVDIVAILQNPFDETAWIGVSVGIGAAPGSNRPVNVETIWRILDLKKLGDGMDEAARTSQKGITHES